MTDLIELAERIEAANGDEARFPGDLIRKAWEALNGGHDYLEGLTDTDSRARWFTARSRLNALIDAGAYLDAAMTLIPEGCVWRLNKTFVNAGCNIFAKDPFREIARCPRAATPALALTAASLRARAAQEKK